MYPADLLRLLHKHLGLADGGVVDEATVEGDGALPRFAASAMAWRMRLAFVTSASLGENTSLASATCEVDGPFAFATQHSPAAAGGAVAVGIAEVPERAVDGQAVGARATTRRAMA